MKPIDHRPPLFSVRLHTKCIMQETKCSRVKHSCQLYGITLHVLGSCWSPLLRMISRHRPDGSRGLSMCAILPAERFSIHQLRCSGSTHDEQSASWAKCG